MDTELLEAEWQLNDWQGVEDTTDNEGSTSCETLEEPDIVHVVGDIIHVRCQLLCCCMQILNLFISLFRQKQMTCDRSHTSMCLASL